MGKLSKINKLPPLREQVCESLRRAILAGEIETGERLTEGKLADFLGVSRTPVREAMSILAQMGILRTRESGGYEIFVPSEIEIKEMFEVRLLLEPTAIQGIAKSSNKEFLADLKKILSAIISAHKVGDSSEFALQNLSFRLKLYEACENSVMRKILEQFSQYQHYIAMVTLRDAGVRELVIAGQQAIYDALHTNDANQAQKAIKEHLKRARDSIMAARTDMR